MKEVTQEQIDNAIKDCIWRREICGVSVCAGDILPCTRCIEIGKCDTLRKLFGGDTE